LDRVHESLMTTRWDIVKQLARRRLMLQGASDAVLRALEEASEDVLMGLPENTLQTCAESLVVLTAQGLTEEEAFRRIEQHRSQFVPGTTLPRPLTLATYVRYRLDLESVPGPPISDDYLTEAASYALRAARAAFRR